MKTAVIITGQARTFARCLPSLHWHVFGRLENPYFYVSVANDEDANSMELLKQRYPDVPFFMEKIDQPLLPEPDMSFAAFAPYAITPTRTPGTGPLQGILRQQWHLSRGYKFAMENGAGDGDETTFIRCRADLHFHKYTSNLTRVSNRDGSCMLVRNDPYPREAFTPYWGNYGPGVNDRFAVLGKDAAKAYFETYDVLPELLKDGCPFHPETLVGAAMDRAGITIKRTLGAEFAFLRKDGSLEHMVVFPQELAAYTAHLSKS